MTKRFPLFLEKYTPPTTIFLSAVLILAMLCSKLLLSMATFGLVFLGLGYAAAFPERLKAIRTRYDVLLPILFWFFMVITGFYSRNTQDWLWQIRLMLPYFGLPFVLFLLPAISLKAYKYLHYWLLFLVAIVCITMNIDYALHAADWIVALGKGQSIDPMLLWIKPIDHIRFSLLLAFSALASAYFFIENSETPRFERVLMAISFILNTETLHLLTVRIGLLAFYAIAIAGLFILIIRKKKWLLGTTILAGIVALPFFAMKIMPNLYTKFYYSYWDLLQYKNGTLTETSDVGRLNSIVSGIYIGNSSPVIGVGYGDILAESGYQYAKSNFDRQELAKKYLTYLQKIVQKNA